MEQDRFEKLSIALRPILHARALSGVHDRNLSYLSLLFPGPSELYDKHLIALCEVLHKHIPLEAFDSFTIDSSHNIDDLSNEIIRTVVTNALPHIKSARLAALEDQFKDLFDGTNVAPNRPSLINLLEERGVTDSEVQQTVIGVLVTGANDFAIPDMGDTDEENEALLHKYILVVLTIRWDNISELIEQIEIDIKIDGDNIFNSTVH